MKMQAFRERSNLDFNDQIEIAFANAIFSNPPKDLDIKKFLRGNPSEAEKSEEQKNNELLVALANFSDRFR